MRFSCEKSTLSDAIAVCIHAVGSKTTSPVMEGLLITAENDVTMSGFNYKTGIQRTFAASVYEPGAVVLNARILSDIVRKLPDEIVEVLVDERLMATIKCGSSEFNIIASDAKEFPEMPVVPRDEGFTVPDLTLKELIGGTIFAVCENENKPIITGSLFETDGKTLRMVSVDGYRLAVRQAELQEAPPRDFSFVVPGETLKEIYRILPDDEESCFISPQKKHALFDFAGTLVNTRLLEGEFLNWRAAIPQDQPVNVRLNKAELIDAVERVSLIISERLKNPVRCIFEGNTLKLSCITALGRSYDECRIPDVGPAIEIGFNNRYLLDALRACPDDEFILGLKSGLSPCTMTPVEGQKFTYLVLPVRLKAGE